jgi:starch phosphorylase
MCRRFKVGFPPEYDVSLQRLLPASDISSQISTGGYEASGASDMKFMMNGALNRDSRRGEHRMGQEAGDEDFFLFDLTSNRWSTAGRGAAPIGTTTTNGGTRAALVLILSDHFSCNEPGFLAPLRDTLLTQGDHYMHLADLTACLEAYRKPIELFADPGGVARKVILNAVSSGKFSSDRTIAEPAAEIWHVKACPVE